jgi:hypothetical protein
MGAGESIFFHLNAQRETRKQYRLGFMPPASGTGPYTLTVDAGKAALNVVADDFSEHGLMFWSLRVTASGEQVDGRSTDGLEILVERIVSEVESPYGAFSCVEQDRHLGVAVLRTEPGVDRRFFEARVNGGDEVELDHFVVVAGSGERRQEPVNLGRAVFESLTDSLVAALDGSLTVLR